MYKKILYFIALATILSCTLGLLASYIFPHSCIPTVFYALGIFVASLILKEKSIIQKKYTSFTYIIFSFVLPLVYVGIIYIISLFFDISIKFNSFTYILITIPCVLLGAFFEEYGWRGYLFKHLENMGWIKMNTIIGIVWSLWHWPAIFTYNYTILHPLSLGIISFTINLILLSFIFAWFRQKTGSILTPTILHATHNIAFTYVFFYQRNTIWGESGYVFTIVLLLFILIITAWKKPKYLTT